MALVLLLWIFSGGLGLAEDQRIPMPPDRESLDLGPHLDILEDPGGKLNVTDAAGENRARDYRPWNSASINLGLTKSAFWLRFSMESGGNALNPGRTVVLSPGTWWLELGEALPGRVQTEVYSWGGPGHGYTWLKPNRLRLIKLNITPMTPHWFYVRITSDTSIILYPQVYTTDHFLQSQSNRLVWLGVFYGLLAVVCIYHFFAYISILDKSYLWYAIHLFFLIAYFLGINGILGEYVFVGRFEMVGVLSRTFLGLVIWFGGLFTRSFLMTRDNAPWLDRLVLIGIIPGLILAVLNPVLPVRITNAALILGGLCFPVITLIVGLVLLRHGFKPARYFVLAWSAFLLGGMVMALTFSGVMQYSSTLRLHGFQIGAALAAVLFSIAFNDRVRLLRLEKDRLSKRESRISTILDSIRGGVLLIDPPTGVILEANHEAARIIGVGKDEIIGKIRHAEIFSDAAVSTVKQGNSEKLNGVETTVTRLDGRAIPVLVSASSIALDGKAYVLESLIDISRRKKLEEERERLIAELQAHLAEIKTLQGFLPICSNCKKVRDDDGYWQQIEQYIQDHSQAEFSHSICPDCMREMYPDVADAVLKRLGKKKDGKDRIDN